MVRENKIAILVDEKDLQLILSSLDFYSWSTTDEHDRRLDLITDFREFEKRLKAKLDEAKPLSSERKYHLYFQC